MVIERIKAYMAENNLRLSELSRMAQIPYATLNDLIQGITDPMRIGVDKVLRLSVIMNTTVEDLYGEEQQPHPLTPAETSLLEDFRDLNGEGQEKVAGYAKDLLATGQYKKSHQPGVVQEA